MLTDLKSTDWTERLAAQEKYCGNLNMKMVSWKILLVKERQFFGFSNDW